MTLAIIQSRLGSSRLPRKVTEKIGRKTMLHHVSERANAIRGVDMVTIATPGCALHLGENDVLGRFAHVLRMDYPSADVVMRLTGDCPLLAPDLAEEVLALYRETKGCEYAWIDTRPEQKGWPDGVDVEVFSRKALLWAEREATDKYDREHCTPWIRRHVKTMELRSPLDYSDIKWSVDTAEDLERVRAIYAQLPPDDYTFKTTLQAHWRAVGACISKA